MFRKLFTKYWPHGLWILIFLVISGAFFSPLISGKKVMFQSDIQQAEGMSHEIKEHEKATGEQSLWTNSMFSGMPTYQIKAAYPNNWSGYIFSALTYVFNYDRYPIASMWMLMVCIFLLMLAMDINVWAAGALAIGYAFSTYNIIGIETGHANKIWTLMYAPLILAGIAMVFKKNYLSGAALTALGLAINIYANHLQITYYLFITILVWMIVKLVFAIKDKQVKDFAIAASILVASALVGVSTNTSNLWTTYEYGKASTRGGSELSFEEDASKDGLSFGYVFDEYSYGRTEILTFLIPNYSGGASAMDVAKDSEVAKLTKQTERMPTYWGTQRYVAGPYYLGAIICFLMVLGLVLAKNNATKIWLMVMGFLAISLSTGKNSLFLSDFFYYNFPLYNKFRVPTIITGIIQICFVALAALGLNEFIRSKEEPATWKKLNLAFYITGGLCLLLAVAGPMFIDFAGPADEKLGITDKNFLDQFLTAMREDRASLMRKDAFRSLALIAATFGILWAFSRKKLSLPVSFSIIAVFLLIDMWPVNTRYMSDDTYKPKKNSQNLFTPSVADNAILQDKSLDYRVLNLSVDAFSDATTSYYHKSIGGYHGAKLRRYQDLIAFAIREEADAFTNILRQPEGFAQADSFMRSRMPVLNMLNTKYFIINPQGAPLPNPAASGNAWFANEIKWAGTADEEFISVKEMKNPAQATISKELQDKVAGFTPPASSNGKITLKSYQPDHLVYESESANEELAIFSEIYYPYGWVATIDGQEAEHFRANYVLRAMKVPAGKHTIEFTFHPKSYYTGEKIALAGSITLVLLCVSAIGMGVRNLSKENV